MNSISNSPLYPVTSSREETPSPRPSLRQLAKKTLEKFSDKETPALKKRAISSQTDEQPTTLSDLFHQLMLPSSPALALSSTAEWTTLTEPSDEWDVGTGVDLEAEYSPIAQPAPTSEEA